jgi:hypothetical protein
MRVTNQPIELIIETSHAPQSKSKSAAAPDLRKALKEGGITIDNMTPAQKATGNQQAKTMTAAPASNKVYVKTTIKDYEMNPWDAAHLSAKALGAASTFVEPDEMQEYVTDNNIDVPYKKNRAAKTGGAKVPEGGYDPDWKPHKNSIWHLDDAFSQLKSAREAVMELDGLIRIGHLDTGYSKTHAAISVAIKNNPLQRNFIDGEDEKDAHDRLTGGMLRMPGHGLGTLGILAGGK